MRPLFNVTVIYLLARALHLSFSLYSPQSAMPPEVQGPNYHSGKSGSASPTDEAGRQPGSPHSLAGGGPAAGGGAQSAANTGRAGDASGKDALGVASGQLGHNDSSAAPIGAHLVDAQVVGGTSSGSGGAAQAGGAGGELADGAFGSAGAGSSGSAVDVDVVTGVLEKRGAWSTPGYKRWTARFIVISK